MSSWEPPDSKAYPQAYPAKVAQAPYFLAGAMALPAGLLSTAAPQATRDEAVGTFQTQEKGPPKCSGIREGYTGSFPVGELMKNEK